MKIGEIVKKYREEHGLSMRQFAKLAGLSHAYVPLIERGTNHNGEPLIPSITAYKQIADAMGLSLHELVKMVDEDERVDISSDGNNEVIPGLYPIKKKRFPVLGRVACGEPIFAEEDRETFIRASSDIDADFCLIAQGDSMTGAHIEDGDILFIKQMPVVPNGKIAVVLIGDEATVKYIDYRQETATLILTPANPAFRTQIYQGEELEQVRVIGMAVCLQKMLVQ